MQQFRIDFQRNRVEKRPVRSAGVKRIGVIQLIASDGSSRNGPRHAAIREKAANPERFVFGLVLHILAARGRQQEQQQDRGGAKRSQLPKLLLD
jgi:hypothetical protein